MREANDKKSFVRCLGNTRHRSIICMIAFFNFVFLGTEYLFDDLCAKYVAESQVVYAQNIVLGVSAVGFVMYGFLYRWFRGGVVRGVEIVLAVLFLCGMGCLNVASSYMPTLLTGCVLFLILGIMGAKVCYYATNRLADLGVLAKITGFGYALGILLQFINNNVIRGDVVQSVILLTGFLITFMLAGWAEKMPEGDHVGERQEVRSTKYTILTLVLVIVFLTMIFATLDNAVTLVHASGAFDIGQWPRLILAVSGIAAGFLFDLKERKLMPFLMYVIAVLSVICIIVIETGGSFLAGLFVFYMSAGFFVVFFMTAFMEISFYTDMPRVWAGKGRGVNNLCAFATTAMSLALLNRESPMLIMIVAIVLLVLISISMLLYYHYGRIHAMNMTNQRVQPVETSSDHEECEISEKTECKKENSFLSFAEEYALTEREREVLSAIVDSNSTVQEVAKELAMSRAALYRHISNMNEKTNTKDRKDLIRLYYEKGLE